MVQPSQGKFNIPGIKQKSTVDGGIFEGSNGIKTRREGDWETTPSLSFFSRRRGSHIQPGIQCALGRNATPPCAHGGHRGRSGRT